MCRKDLEKTFDENDQLISILKHVKDCYNQAMADSPFLGQSVSVRPLIYKGGNDLYIEGTDNGMEHILKNYPDLMASIVNYKAKTGPFH